MNKKIAELNVKIGELSHKMKWNENAEEWYQQDILLYDLKCELNTLLAKKNRGGKK